MQHTVDLQNLNIEHIKKLEALLEVDGPSELG